MGAFRYKKAESSKSECVDRLTEFEGAKLIEDYRERIEMHEEDKVRIDKQITKCNSEIKKIEDAMK